MKFALNLITALGFALGLSGLIVFFGIVVTGCAVERYAPATDSRVDSALTVAGLPPLRAGKVVFRGPVTLQTGGGNTSSTVGTDKTGQRAQALSTGPGSPVTATTEKGGVAWWVFAIVAVVGAALWEWLSHRLNPLGWLPWRPKT